MKYIQLSGSNCLEEMCLECIEIVQYNTAEPLKLFDKWLFYSYLFLVIYSKYKSCVLFRAANLSLILPHIAFSYIH